MFGVFLLFAEHFPKENVRQNAFCRFLTFCKQNVRAASNAFLHQMHLMLNILQSKMFSITFSFGKCSAPTKCKGTAKAEKCCVFCFAKNKDAEHFPKGKCSAKSKKTKHSKKERQCKNVSLQLVKCTYTLRRLIICKKCNVKFSYRSVKSSI